MAAFESRHTLIRFGIFEADLGTGELRKSGRKIRLQEQPFRVLAALLERPDEVVTREELQKRLWPADTFVNFDTGLNRCIKKIREALDDSAETPRYVETLPKRGYRFIAPVSPVTPQFTAFSDKNKSQISQPRNDWQGYKVYFWLRAGLLVVVVGVVFALQKRRTERPLLHPQINSIAVLPLDNLSSDASDEFFADGMTDELITQLAKAAPLSVISRTSVMQYKHAHKPLSAVAKELNVDAVVEGTVTRSGQQIRVTAQLIDAHNDHHLWAEEYERPIRDVLGLQTEVAGDIAGQIRNELAPRNPPRHPVNPDAYEAYLRGTNARGRMSADALNKSLEYFQQAIQLDPNYAEAYAGVSHTNYVLGILGFQPSVLVYPKAKDAAKKALQLDPTNAEAYNTLADVEQGYDRDWKTAESQYKQALRLNPSYAIAHTGYADLLARTGRSNEAIAEARRARELDPLSSQTTAFLGFILYQTRRYDEAVTECKTALDFDANNPGAHWWLALAYEQQHRFSDAIAELQTAVRVSRDGSVYEAALGEAYGLAGEKGQALRILNDLKLRSKSEYVSAFDIAIVYVGLNDKESAMHWLEKAYDERAMRLEQITEPAFDGFRSDARFQDLERRIGLLS